MPFGIKLHIWGDYACFTRPEMKAERVSYDVITPSAARGVLEAIYWKPQCRWVVTKIHVLNPIRFTNIRRNEVGEKIPAPSRKVRKGESTASSFFIEDKRQQRASLILQDVAYVIEARLELVDKQDPLGKHYEIFQRRARRGQCFHHPYLGTREFLAHFALIEPDAALPPVHPEVQGERNLGYMLHDIEFEQDSRTKKVKSTTPRFFPAEMKNGAIEVPPFHQSIA